MERSQITLDRFAHLRDSLARALSDLSGVFTSLDDSQRGAGLLRDRDRLLDDRFRIVVLGEMKRGKSTLINALLGVQLLPMKEGLACTAIPISVSYRSSPWVVCHKRSQDKPDAFDPTLEPRRFREAVTLPGQFEHAGSEEEAEAFASHPFVRAELSVPAGLLQCGVQIQDSAGLNEHARRTTATWAQVEECDAVVLVLSLRVVGSKSDREDLAAIVRSGRDPRVIFTVWNHADAFADDPSALSEVCRQALGMVTEQQVSPEHVFFVSAREAVLARRDSAASRLEKSGLPALEKALSTFLVDKGLEAKLLTPLKIAEHGLEEALVALLVKRNSEWSKMEELSAAAVRESGLSRERLDEFGPKLRRRFESVSEGFQASVGNEAIGLIKKLVEGVDSAAMAVDVSASDAIFDTKTAAARVIAAIDAWTRRRVREWERSRFEPLLETYRTDIAEVIESGLAEFRREARALRLRAQQLGIRPDGASSSVEADGADGALVEHSDVLDRLRFSTDALTSEDLSPGGVGLGAFIGAATGAWLAMVFALPLLLPLIAAAVVGGMLGGSSGGDKLKRRVAEEVKRALLEKGDRLVDEILEKASELINVCDNEALQRFERAETSLTELADAIAREHASRQVRSRQTTDLAEELRGRLEQLAVVLAGLRREIDAQHSGHDFQNLVGQLVEQLKRAPVEGSGGAQSTDLGKAASLLELKLRLQKGTGWASLQRCKEHLQRVKRWAPEMELKLAQWWTQCDAALDVRSSLQAPTFRAVTALVLSAGASEPPSPAAVRELWRDRVMREQLLQLWCLVQGETGDNPNIDTSDFTDDEVGQFGSGGDRFCKRYERALKAMVKPDLTWGTVIDGKQHRDPHRPPE